MLLRGEGRGEKGNSEVQGIPGEELHGAGRQRGKHAGSRQTGLSRGVRRANKGDTLDLNDMQVLHVSMCNNL